jgi:uncharacterized membrane protein HdeD (DUF308 family)
MTETMDSAAKEVKKSGGLVVLLGILTIVLGVLCMGAPLVTGLAVGMLAGGFLLIGGIFKIIFAFKAPTWGKGILGFLLGALTILCGLIMLGRPLLGLASLTLVLAAYFLVDGIFEIIVAFQIKPMKGWGWTLVSGIAAVLLGYLIWRQWPLSGAWAIGILVGINLIMSGWSMIAFGGVTRAVASEAQASDV